MVPMVTPGEMRAIDAAASVSTDVLVARAGWAVAAEVRRRVGAYGRHVIVVAGPGNNGADGRVAAELLRRAGARCRVIGVGDLPPTLPDCDVLIDAAFGTGLRDSWTMPGCRAGLTVAVDIASGVDGLTGRSLGEPRPADVTVTFAAAKPGLYLNDGPALSGDVVVADIGLDVGQPRWGVAEPGDLRTVVAERSRDAHKWRHAVWVMAGSPSMFGAGELCATAAMRSGASYVRWTPLGAAGPAPVAHGAPEVVIAPREAAQLADGPGADGDRFAAGILGPGLGRDETVTAGVRAVAKDAAIPLVLDADALWAIGSSPLTPADGGVARIMTPHDGEYEYLMGSRPVGDRVSAASSLAERHNTIALLKGPTTIVASPDGRVRIVSDGDQRLATAGTGDVLSGCIAGCLATGVDPFDAAWAGAMICALAARRCPPVGTVAGDVVGTIPSVMSEIHA